MLTIGRNRFQQCEQMTAHYKQPILLIEFDEKKSFNMEVRLFLWNSGSRAADMPRTRK